MSMFILVSAPLLFDAPIPGNLPGYFLSLVLLIFASLCIGTVFGLFFKGASKMGMAGQLIFLPSLMLSGIMFPVSLLPDALRQAGKFFPATWGFSGMCDDKTDMGNLIPLAAIALLAILLSVWKLKKLQAE